MVSALDGNPGATLVQDPLHEVLTRLAEPKTVESLNVLLDHADLLAILVTGLDGLLSRGDTIADSVADTVRELRPAGEPGLDIARLLTLGRQLVAAAPAVLTMLPVLERVASSGLSDPRLIDLASTVSAAAVQGAEEANRRPARIAGVRALWRAAHDEDVARTLGFAVTVAKALGQELARTEPPGATAQPPHA